MTAERAARQQAEARASGAEAMVAYLKLLIAKMKRSYEVGSTGAGKLRLPLIKERRMLNG